MIRLSNVLVDKKDSCFNMMATTDPSVHIGRMSRSLHSKNQISSLQSNLSRTTNSSIHVQRIPRPSANQNSTCWSSNDSENSSQSAGYYEDFIWPFRFWKERSQSISYRRKIRDPSVHVQIINRPVEYVERIITPSKERDQTNQMHLYRINPSISMKVKGF